VGSFFKKGLWGILGLSVKQAGNFILHFVLAFSFVDGGYGAIALSLTVSYVIQVIIQFGLNIGFIKFQSQIVGGNSNRLASTMTVFTFIFAILIMAIFYLLTFQISLLFNSSQFGELFSIVIFVIPFNILSLFLGVISQSKKNIRTQQLTEIIRAVLIIVLAFVIYIFGLDLISYAYLYVFLSVLVSISSVYLVFFKHKIFVFEIPKWNDQFSSLIVYSLPLFLVNFSNIFLLNMDRIMLGYYVTDKELGVYSFVSTLAIQQSIILVGFTFIASPIIAELSNKGDIGLLEKFYKGLTKTIIYATIPIFIMLYFVGDTILGLVNTGYFTGFVALKILILGQLINAGTGPIGKLFEMTGRRYITLFSGLCVLALNFGLNIYLIPIYGIEGAAVATAVSNFLIFSLLVVVARKSLSINIYHKSLKIFFPWVILLFVGCIFLFEVVPNQLIYKIMLIFSVIVVYVIVLFKYFMADEDRAFITTTIKLRKK